MTLVKLLCVECKGTRMQEIPEIKIEGKTWHEICPKCLERLG